MNKDKNNQIIIYNTDDGSTKIEVKLKDKTVRLSQKQVAELFDCSVDNISLHLKNMYFERELEENQSSDDSSIVQIERGRKARRPVKTYNFDAIIPVGYRINYRAARISESGRHKNYKNLS